MSLPFGDAMTVLSAVLTALSTGLGIIAVKNNRAKTIAIAIAAAETAIDKTAYNSDGTLNAARVQLAETVLDHVIPNANPAVVDADLKALLAVVHSHAQSLVPAAAATAASSTPVTPAK